MENPAGLCYSVKKYHHVFGISMKPPGISSGIRWCEVTALSDDKMLFIDPPKQVIGILRSTTTISMKPISYLLVPIKLKYVKLTFGKRVCKKDRERYSFLLTRLKNEENKHE